MIVTLSHAQRGRYGHDFSWHVRAVLWADHSTTVAGGLAGARAPASRSLGSVLVINGYRRSPTSTSAKGQKRKGPCSFGYTETGVFFHELPDGACRSSVVKRHQCRQRGKHYAFIDTRSEGAISHFANFGFIQPRLTLGSIAGRDR
jgi:hypothetical protein